MKLGKRATTSIIIFIVSLIFAVPLYLFFSPLSLLLPFLIAASYYLIPIFKYERLKYSEAENAFVFSLLVASYSYIYKDVFNAIVASIKVLKNSKSLFVKNIASTSWKNITIDKKVDLKRINNKFISSVDPFFQDVLSLTSSSLKEQGEKSLQGIKTALTFHTNSIFSSLLEKSRNSVNPTRIIFSILIIFPVFLLIMLPLAVLFLPEVVSSPNLFLVFNIVIPILSFLALEWFSIHLLTKPSFYSFKSRNVQYGIAVISILLLFVSLISFFFSESIYVVVSFLLFSLTTFFTLYILYRKDYIELLKNYELIDKLPSFFIILSKQLSKGIPFERAMIDAEKKEKININSSMFLLGKDMLKMDKVLSSYSYFIDILREASKKNITNEIASVINHFLNLKKESEEKIRFINEETLHSAKLLIIFVIPVIAAVSSAFSDSLDKLLSAFNFGELAFFEVSNQPFLLTFILSLYTVEMIFVLTLFVSKLEGIRDPFYYIYEMAKNLALGFIVFSITFVLSVYFINLSTVVI